MTADVVIRAEGLGKKYLIGHQAQERGSTFRDVLVRSIGNFAQSARDILTGKPIIAGDSIEEFWALKDVNFEIKRGDVVGIIGRNGAGKSTLLKVLSRITEPTEGRVEINGRVASLLEVGTGFHPELTGRENVYLNGAILGMSRAEIRRKFDEIVAFAEIEKFLDTPVKRYSSGMYVRLAFAVAAHLEPEILIVDEVLAVGDAEFQKKCLGKMQDVAGHGRTVLFVSHNVAAVKQLCTRGVFLSQGKVAHVGMAADAMAEYYSQTLLARQTRVSASPNSFVDLFLQLGNGQRVLAFVQNQTAFIEGELEIQSHEEDVQAGFTIYNSAETPLVLISSESAGARLPKGRVKIRIELPTELLRPGSYRLEGAIWDRSGPLYQNDCLLQFEILQTGTQEMLGRSSAALFVSRQPWRLSGLSLPALGK